MILEANGINRALLYVIDRQNNEDGREEREQRGAQSYAPE
jgi:hypothetical protein